MASLKLSHIYKVYDNGHKAVNDFSIDIKDKEFIVFVGPSGCGKSTTLRMIAGLEQITAGDLFIGDTLVNDMEPKDRDIAMVFQNYALYPHMSVYENMAFGLRNRHLPEAEIKQKVLEAAKILDIEDYLNRKPKAMSGGQRQRVALGRAIVRDPKVFLLDEPLSNLDAKLRAQMRTEITKLHQKLQTTFIYVTHDQVEAMTMGTRIVVMKLGYVQQIDTPMNLYNEPYNKFVAGFIGTPQMNFFDVTLLRNDDVVDINFINGEKITIPYERVSKAYHEYLNGEKKVIFGVRPEHISLSENKQGLPCVVNAVEHLGNECIIYAELQGGNTEFSMKDQGRNIVIKTIEGLPVNVGDIVYAVVNDTKLHFFDGESEITIIKKIPDYTAFEAKIDEEEMSIFNSNKKLPPVYLKALENREKITLQIPPHAIVKGNDFKLKVIKIEKINNQNLAYLSYEDRYLFALVDDEVKEGEYYEFSILMDKIRVVDGNCTILEALKNEESLIGRFEKSETKEPLIPLPQEEIDAYQKEIETIIASNEELISNLEILRSNLKDMPEENKEEKASLKLEIRNANIRIKDNKALISELEYKKKQKTGGRVYHFFANINGVKIELPRNNGYKMNSVEGNACYKRLYRYEVDRKKIQILPEHGINASVSEILDYGNIVYAKLIIDDQEIYLEVDPQFNQNEISISLSGEDISIYSTEIEMKIC